MAINKIGSSTPRAVANSNVVAGVQLPSNYSKTTALSDYQTAVKRKGTDAGKTAAARVQTYLKQNGNPNVQVNGDLSDAATQKALPSLLVPAGYNATQAASDMTAGAKDPMAASRVQAFLAQRGNGSVQVTGTIDASTTLAFQQYQAMMKRQMDSFEQVQAARNGTQSSGSSSSSSAPAISRSSSGGGVSSSGGSSGVTGAASGSIPATEVAKDLYDAGFRGDALVQMVAIAGRESSYVPGVVNDNKSTGDLSYGLFQINVLGSLGKPRADQLSGILRDMGITPPPQPQIFEYLKDPKIAAKMAFGMSDNGTNLRPWGGYKGQANNYDTNMTAARQAVASAGLPPDALA